MIHLVGSLSIQLKRFIDVGTLFTPTSKKGNYSQHVDEFSRTALQAAALKGQSLIVKLLLENGADMILRTKMDAHHCMRPLVADILTC